MLTGTILRSDPAVQYASVTPSDLNDLPNGPCRALYVGVQGDVAVTPVSGGAAVVFKAVLGLLQVQAARVYATSTTATYIVALY